MYVSCVLTCKVL